MLQVRHTWSQFAPAFQRPDVSAGRSCVDATHGEPSGSRSFLENSVSGKSLIIQSRGTMPGSGHVQTHTSITGTVTLTSRPATHVPTMEQDKAKYQVEIQPTTPAIHIRLPIKPGEVIGGKMNPVRRQGVSAVSCKRCSGTVPNTTTEVNEM